MIRTSRLSRGLTLIEAVVASALAVVLGFLMLQFISSSFGAHRKGTLSRTAESGTRSLIGLLVGELRSASVPPMAAPVATTPVFWPGVWGSDQETPGQDFGAFYPRLEEADQKAGRPRDTVTNRLLYVRSAESDNATSLDPLARYALVELLVPQETPGRLERRVYSLSSLPQPLRQATVKGADGAQRQAWVLDLPEILNRPAPVAPDILYDAGPDSRIAFQISHLEFAPLSDPGRTRNPENFDPGVFRIEVVVALDPQLSSAVNIPWPAKEQWDTLRSEVTELRIPAVRSN